MQTGRFIGEDFVEQCGDVLAPVLGHVLRDRPRIKLTSGNPEVIRQRVSGLEEVIR
jgi:hypothetical protein